MAKFNPDEVEALGYNFLKFGGQEADIPEPTDEKMMQFWKSTLELLDVSNSGKQTIARLLTEDGPKDKERDSDEYKLWSEDRDNRIRELVSSLGKRGVENLDRRREILAAVCSDQPSVDEMRMLPYRVFNAFEAYILGALSPEGLTTALNI